jgi:hypothetical protein
MVWIRSNQPATRGQETGYPTNGTRPHNPSYATQDGFATGYQLKNDKILEGADYPRLATLDFYR